MKEVLIILLFLLLSTIANFKNRLGRIRNKGRILFREGVDVIKSLIIFLTIFLKLGVFSKEELEKMGIKMDR